jgi:site-specific DNA recombinase
VCFNRDNSDKGILTYNKRDYRKNSAPFREPSEWIITRGSHKGTISGKTWVEVQRLLKSKTLSTSQNTNKTLPLLSGKIFCKRCGNEMLVKRRGSDNFDYICRQKLLKGRNACCIQNLSGAKTDEMVLADIINSLPKSDKQFNELGIAKSDDSAQMPQTDAKKNAELINHIIDKIEWDGNTLKVFLP